MESVGNMRIGRSKIPERLGRQVSEMADPLITAMGALQELGADGPGKCPRSWEWMDEANTILKISCGI